jgi:methylmalonyl-CoA mutase C-terminal domain/subunit
MEAGFEVIYTGLRQSVDAIVQAALEEDVDVIGLSIMSGSHIPICERMKARLDEAGLGGKKWIVGGNIPARDREKLLATGVHAVFATGSRFEDIVGWLEANA